MPLLIIALYRATSWNQASTISAVEIFSQRPLELDDEGVRSGRKQTLTFYRQLLLAPCPTDDSMSAAAI
jgi:hypothetical protein